MRDAGRVVLRHGSRSQQATFVHVVINSIHYHRPPVPRGARSVLEPVPCAASHVPLTLAHLAVCADASCAQPRQQLQRAIVALLSEYAATRDWLRLHRRLPLPELLTSLFPPPAPPAAARDAERQRRLTRLLCGAFTRREANAAAKRVGLDPLLHRDDATAMLLRLRLACLDSVASLYDERKAAAAAAAAAALLP
jgi:hypothetical protein